MPVLYEMGIKEVFTKKANLSGMIHFPELHVSNILQDSYLEINERYTEAVVSTIASVMVSAAPWHEEEIETFHANRPFFFIIHDQANDLIIFMGDICNFNSKTIL